MSPVAALCARADGTTDVNISIAKMKSVERH
jgi:hypothetical protein